jgi:hypothetical protein
MLPEPIAATIRAALHYQVNGQPLAALVAVELCIVALALLAYAAGRTSGR